MNTAQILILSETLGAIIGASVVLYFIFRKKKKEMPSISCSGMNEK